MQRVDMRAGAFTLRSYRRFADPADGTLTVYIEGDGGGWIAGQQQADPTPILPTALALAEVDPSPNRLYLARPCQYQPPDALARCSPSYWSLKRYAEEVVAGLSGAVDQAMRESGAKRLRLVGFSGGGPTAALIAARRADVFELVTVAGNLDHR